MKKVILLICLTISFCGFSQNETSTVSRLTEIMLAKNYSSSDRIELNKYPAKLNTLDYIYSKSFQVSEHQNYTTTQFEKIDIDKYNTTRKLNEYVLVFDEASGLQLVLFSSDKMEADKKILNSGNALNQNTENKIAK